jgi:hypothetical protein
VGNGYGKRDLDDRLLQGLLANRQHLILLAALPEVRAVMLSFSDLQSLLLNGACEIQASCWMGTNQ